MSSDKSNDKISKLHNAKLIALGFHEHLLNIFKKHSLRLLSSFSAIFFPLIGITEIFIYTPDLFSDLEFSLLVAGVSVLFAIIYTTHHYLNLSPEGFENESREIKKIAHLKRPQWEYKLAKKLMEGRLSKIDKELKDLIEGKKYIGIAKKPGIYEYWEWINIRMDNLKRMLDPMLVLLVSELPKSIGGKNGKPASPNEILETVEKIRTLYNQTYEYELEGHQIDPPDMFKTLHEYQYGWTHVFRDAINQMFTFLDEVIQHDFKKEKNAYIDFEIKVDAPKNLDKFSEELGKIEL